MAISYAQLGHLAEAQGDEAQAFHWIVRCLTLFPDFPHPSTGPGPDNLARLTAKLGWPALEQTWREVTGDQLSEPVRRWIEERLEE